MVVRFGRLIEAREGDVPLIVDVLVAAPRCDVHVEGSVLDRSINRAVVVIDIGLAHVVLIPQMGMRIPHRSPCHPPLDAIIVEGSEDRFRPGIESRRLTVAVLMQVLSEGPHPEGEGFLRVLGSGLHFRWRGEAG